MCLLHVLYMMMMMMMMMKIHIDYMNAASDCCPITNCAKI